MVSIYASTVFAAYFLFGLCYGYIESGYDGFSLRSMTLDVINKAFLALLGLAICVAVLEGYGVHVCAGIGLALVYTLAYIGALHVGIYWRPRQRARVQRQTHAQA